MNITKLLPFGGSIAAACLAAAAATYVQADPATESTAAQGSQFSKQQLWNFAAANAEGFNSGAASSVDARVDAVAKAR